MTIVKAMSSQVYQALIVVKRKYFTQVLACKASKCSPMAVEYYAQQLLVQTSQQHNKPLIPLLTKCSGMAYFAVVISDIGQSLANGKVNTCVD